MCRRRKRPAALNLLVFFFACSGCSHQSLSPPPPALQAPLKPAGEGSPLFVPNRSFLIAIDAGHGGKDFGTHSPASPKYEEKSLTLATARLLNHYLASMGYPTVMTRGEDLFVPLLKRAEIANSSRACLFVSIHYNSAPKEQAEGIEIYYYHAERDKKRSSSSKELAETILKQLIETTYAKSRGVKRGNFAVIRETSMPAVLIEAGFLTNKGERERIHQRGYLKRIASSIALGIDQYLKK